jgi:NAD(P)H-hydrate epimerase
MPPLILSRDQVREFDRRAIAEYGLPGAVLMENAGRGVADFIGTLGTRSPIVILCGQGNNGGDGFVIARHLELRGCSVRVLAWLKDRAQPPGDGSATAIQPLGEAELNLRVLERAGTSLRRMTDANLGDELVGASLIVDALLGTGARGEPREPLSAVIDMANASGLPIVAVDLPSGLDCDTGEPARHTIRAAHTCTFVALKRGFLQPQAAPYLGQVHVLDIGAPRKLLNEFARETSA